MSGLHQPALSENAQIDIRQPVLSLCNISVIVTYVEGICKGEFWEIGDKKGAGERGVERMSKMMGFGIAIDEIIW